MKTSFLALVLAAALGTLAHAHQPPPAAPPAGAGKPGIVRGRITAADTGKPLRRARIVLTPTTRTSALLPVYAYTNSGGNFEAKGVAPGTYIARVERDGYLALQYGQRRPRDRGATLEVRPGETVAGIDVALPRGGVLAGIVVDELGEPYPGVRVDALAVRYTRGRRGLFPVRVETTDDQGGFRLANLEPGSYYLAASSTETWRGEKKETIGYASSYYPSGPVDRAQAIELGPSEVKTSLHIGVEPSRAACVSGRVMRETGEAMPNTQVALAYSYPGVVMTAGMRSTTTKADGSFEFKDVAGGLYQLSTAGALQQVTVAGADIDNLLLVSRTGSTVHGALVTDEGTPPPFPAPGVRVLLEAPFDNVLATIRLVSIEPDWSFKLTNLGGPFLFRLTGLPDDWMLASVTLGEKDVTDVPWDVPTGGREITGLTISVTQKVGRVNGTVVDAKGTPSASGVVVVFADDPEAWMPGSRFLQTTRPGSDGRFALTNLPAGAYRAAVRPYVEEGQWEDPDFLEQLRPEAIVFTLAEGGTETLALKLPRQ